jgi:hypothetical protein
VPELNSPKQILSFLALTSILFRRLVQTAPPSSTELKECRELYFQSSITLSWRGAQLKKSTGATSPLPLTLL